MSAATPRTAKHRQEAKESSAVDRKPRGRGHERREEILAAAGRLFVEFGYKNVTTRKIAEELGVSQTALYVYFPNKDSILDGLCEVCFASLINIFQAEMAAGGPAPEILRRMMRAYVRFGLENPVEYRIGFMVQHDHETKSLDEPPEQQPAGMRCYLIMQAQVAALARECALNCDPVVAAQALWAAGHGIVALLITMPEFPWVDRTTLIEQIVEIQMRGVLSTATNTTN